MKNEIKERLGSLTSEVPDALSFNWLRNDVVRRVQRAQENGVASEYWDISVGSITRDQDPQRSAVAEFARLLTDSFAEEVAQWIMTDTRPEEHYFKTSIEGLFIKDKQNPAGYAVTHEYRLVGTRRLPTAS